MRFWNNLHHVHSKSKFLKWFSLFELVALHIGRSMSNLEMRKRIDENEEFAVAILFKFFGVLASKNVYLFGLILLKVNTEMPHVH